MSTGCSFCNGVMTATQEKTSSGLYGKPVCAKDECAAKAKKEADAAAEALMTPRDRTAAWLARHDFEEQSVKGFWLHKDTIVAVNLNDASDEFPGLPQIGRMEINGKITETGHGLSRVEDVRRGLEGVLKPKPQKNGKLQNPVRRSEGSGTALAKIQDVELSVETVLRYIAPKATEQEAAYFLTVCKARNLNPFLNEVYLIKYSETEPASIVTGKATFAKRADLQPDYEGIQSGIIVQTKDGKLERRGGTFYLKDETLLGGWARIFRKGRKEYYEEVALSEYIQRKKDGQPSRFWATMPGTMIKKVAEVHGWRAAFPQEFAGLYDESEVQEVSA